MSDPVTNVEIEDVLSSIRRLVSSDERPPKPQADTQRFLGDAQTSRAADTAPVRDDEASGPAPQSGDTMTAAEADKLVLTPSLRVDSPIPFRAEAADAVAPDVDEDIRDDSDHEVADLDSGDKDWLDEVLNAESGATDETSGRIDALKARVAEWEEAVARQGDHWDPDGTNPDENSGGPGAPLPWEDYTAETDEDEAEGEAADAAPDHDDHDDLAKAVEDAIDAHAPEVQAETADRGGNDMSEDDIPDNFAAADDAAPDAGTDQPRAWDESGDVGADTQDDADMLGASDDFLDEDALRDLVADIVRQELQGALGERITRNVRKLVRREIHRALTSQELG